MKNDKFLLLLNTRAKVLLFCILLSQFLFSCVCVPEIATPKIIVPTEFANVMFVNAVWGSTNYSIKSEYGNILSNFNYGDNNEKKVASGLNNLKVLSSSDSSILYNGFVSLTKDLHYTFILFGTNQRVQAIILPDTISNYIPQNVYLRCVHIATNVPSVDFIIKGAYNIPINCRYRESSDFIALPSGIFDIEIINSETSATILTLENIQLSSERKYYLILRGIFSGSYDSISCQLIEF